MNNILVPVPLTLGWSSRDAVAVAVVAAAACLGCGPMAPVDENRSTVSGVVTFAGKPLPAGAITFQSTEGPLATTFSIGEGGRYATARAPLGANRVSIETESLRFGYPQGYVRIPTRYTDPTQSGLTADVKPGENENVNFELSK